jgi:hypothetical protein
VRALNTPAPSTGEEYVSPEAQAERARLEEIDQKVRDYLMTHPEARYGPLLAPKNAT